MESGVETANPLTAFYPAIRARLVTSSEAAAWPAFAAEVAGQFGRHSLPPPVLLPLASAAAVGGDPARAVGVAAAFSFLLLSVRWFDDTQDRDRDDALCVRLGPARATNLAAGALNLAWSTLAADSALPRSVLAAFGQETTAIARGQDDDLLGLEAVSFEAYWRRMVDKTGAGFALACRLGALAGRDEPAPVAVLARFGRHLGTMVQILDDLDGAFHPNGIGDLASGKVTLPVLYALQAEHAGSEELGEIVRRGQLAAQAGRVRELLDGTDTREFLVWSAFEERDRAFAELATLGPATDEITALGRAALEAIAAGLIADWETLLVPEQVTDVAQEAVVPTRRAYFGRSSAGGSA
ncbi:MAG: polyprenyl synthetase family protein [Thermoanaerobaculia bacterium]|nr:polyprenyl synthetase family protein [Thermoanaerobaculia bacterium]